MTHYHCEIVLPLHRIGNRTEDIKRAVGQVLAPFDEDPPGDDKPKRPTTATAAEWADWADEFEDWASDHCDRGHSFWDWWGIGGRWAGQHIIDRFDPDILTGFYRELRKMEVTVSGVQFGKQELKPASQIPVVDALWRKHFPDSGLGPCPIFRHSNPDGKPLDGDVCKVSELGQWSMASRIIIAGPTLKPTGERTDEDPWTFEKVKATHMLSTEIWNGVTWEDTAWDGSVPNAIKAWNQQVERYRKGYAELVTVTDDWSAVTVDYHS